MASQDLSPNTCSATSGFTPGPWDYVSARTLHHVETSFDNPHGAGTPVCSIPKAREADARLIAAAPELLSQLKHEVANCPMCKGDAVTDQTFEHWVGRLPQREKVECPRCKGSRALIAKAEGK